MGWCPRKRAFWFGTSPTFVIVSSGRRYVSETKRESSLGSGIPRPGWPRVFTPGFLTAYELFVGKKHTPVAKVKIRSLTLWTRAGVGVKRASDCCCGFEPQNKASCAGKCPWFLMLSLDPAHRKALLMPQLLEYTSKLKQRQKSTVVCPTKIDLRVIAVNCWGFRLMI